MNYYPDPNSSEVVALYGRQIGLSDENILVTNGSNHALEVIARCSLNHNSEIIIDSPTYEVMRMQAGIQNAKIVMAFAEDPFIESVEHVLKHVNDQTTAIYLANPANPIGKFYNRPNITKLLDTGKLIILDEAYVDYAPDSLEQLVNQYDNLIITRTLSKAYLAAGLRIGFILANKANIKLIRKVIPPWSLNHISQALAFELLSHESLFVNYVNAVNVSKSFLYQELEKLGLKYHRSHTNFLLVEFKDPDRVVKELYNRNILVSNKSTLKGLAGCVRISIGPLELMKILVSSVQDIISRPTSGG